MKLYRQKRLGQKLCKRAALIALLIAVLALAGGCTTNNTGGTTPNPTAQPMPTATATPAQTEAPSAPATEAPSAQAGAATLSVTVEGKALTEKGVDKDGTAWMPLKGVAEALGYQVQESETGAGEAKSMKLTISPKSGESGEPVEVTYQVSGGAVSEASVTKAGMTQTLTDPLMMVDGTLYAAQKVFVEGLDARVTYDTAAGKVTVAKGSAAP